MIFKINKIYKNLPIQRYYSINYKKFKPPWKVLFFGTDDFSLSSLKALNYEYRKSNIIENLEIVTSFKSEKNPVYMYSKDEKLILHRWPIEKDISNCFDIGLVVSFGHLIPEKIINSFPLGMLNVHASLLPRWRGAAPIIYALANGDTKTGITIMRIQPKHFDVGAIVDQSEIEITRETDQPILYKQLADLGANLLIKSLYELPDNIRKAKPQCNESVSLAPKIDHSFGIVDFNRMTAEQVYNLGRALEGLYPLLVKFNDISIKLYNVKLSEKRIVDDGKRPGFVIYDKIDKLLYVKCNDGNFISVKKLKVHNKKIIDAVDFNNGYLKREKQDLRIFTS